MYRLIFILVVLFMSFAVAGKEYPMLHYTVEDGLPSNTIYDIYQDPDGFIWIGTDKGIARYNGQQFETFTTEDGLADNECFFFRPDYNGRLWIGTYNGKLCYYKDGTFHNEKNTSWLKLPFKASITKQIQVNKDSSITIFFWDEPGFIEIRQDEKIKIYKACFYSFNDDKLKDNNNFLMCLHKRSNNYYEFKYWDEQVNVDSNMKIVSRCRYENVELFKSIRNRNAHYHVTIKRNIVAENHLPTYFKGADRVRNTIIFDINTDNQYEVIATDRGVYFNNNPALLPDETVNVTTKDRNSTYWIGTAKNGVYLVNNHFIQTNIWNDVYRKNTVLYAQRDGMCFFWGTQDRNVYRIKEDEKQATCILKYKQYGGVIELNSVLSSARWIQNGTYYNLGDKNSFAIEEIKGPRRGKVKRIKTIYFWGNNGVYLNDSFIYLKERSLITIIRQSALNFLKDSVKVHSMFAAQSTEVISGAAQDRVQQLWFSTLKNMYHIKDTFAESHPEFGAASFREFIFSGNYMVGVSHNNELLLTNNYEAPKVVFDTVRTNDCVWDKFYKLNDSNLLISTNNYYRILTLHQSKGKPVYSIRLLENPFIPYQPEFLYVDSSSCYFFKNGSISGFPIGFILEKKGLPSLKFVSLTAAGNTVAIRDTMDLSYADSRSINILFSAISFNHKNLTYEYTINNRQDGDSWMVLKGEELNLIKPGFGNYRIKVRAKTMSGEYSPAASFLLSVGKPFWAAWWFLVTGLVLLILLIGYIARLGVRRSLRKKESEVRFLRSEYKALNALMNPHFIFNSLNSVQSLVNNNENIRASKYIRIFSDLIRQNMRNVSQELISLSKEMDLVKNYLKIEQLRFKDQLSYTITVDEDVEADLIKIPPLLIQPLVENAIKHGIWPKKSKDGIIAVSIYEKGEELHIEIVDNGVGLHAGEKSDTLHESYAMSNIHKRIEQLSQIHRKKITVQITELTDEGGNVKGVRSLITISLKEDL